MARVVQRSTSPKQAFSYTTNSGLGHLIPVTCMFNDLRKAPKLRHYPPNTKFLLKSFYCEKFNSVNIIALYDEEDDLFRLSEHILDIAEETDLLLGRTPKTHEVVLAPNKKEYCRAVVLKVVDDVQAEVYFFDVGGFATVEIEKLKPLNASITKFPILGHHVILNDVPSCSPKILLQQFRKEMKAISKKKITIEYVNNPQDDSKHAKIKGLVSQRTVNIFYKMMGNKTSLGDTIQGMEKWEWERYSNLTGNDDEICKNGKFGTSVRMASDVVVSYVDLDPGTIFTAIVSRIHSKGNETDLADLNIILLDEPMHTNYLTVLHEQLIHYTNHIKKSKFFPALNETVLFKLNNDDKKYKDEVKWPGHWVRGVRVSHEMIYLLDFDDFVPFTHLPEEDYEIRPLYREFSTIPNLTIHIRPFENGKQLTMEEAKEKLPAMSRFKFTVIKISDNGYTYDVNFEPEVITKTTF